MSEKAKRLRAKKRAAKLATSEVSPPPRRADGRGAHTPNADPRLVVAEARCKRLGLRLTHENLKRAAGPRFGTPHGILAITAWFAHRDAEVWAQAGDIYAAERAAYLSIKGIAPESPSAPFLGVITGGGYEPSEEAIRAASDAHRASHAALCSAGMLAEAEVVRVCCRLEDEPEPRQTPLMDGLKALAAHYREAGQIA